MNRKAKVLKPKLKKRTQKLIAKGKRSKRPKLVVQGRKRKKYKKQRCMYIKDDGNRCKFNAVGKSTLCKRHGGNPIDVASTMDIEMTNKYLTEVGQMSIFDPATHPILYISLSREGLSDVEIATEFGISIATVKAWTEKFEAFAIAFETGQAMYEAWWLQKGKNNLNSRNFNTSLYKFLTGNKLGFSDKIESKNMNMNQNVHGVLLVPNAVSEEEWEVECAAYSENSKEEKEKS